MILGQLTQTGPLTSWCREGGLGILSEPHCIKNVPRDGRWETVDLCLLYKGVTRQPRPLL